MVNKKSISFIFLFSLGLIFCSQVANAASITVTTPGALTTGTVYNITWTASGTSGQYAIWLCGSGSGTSCDNSYRISSPVTGNSYSWTIPTSLATSSNYRINVYDYGAVVDPYAPSSIIPSGYSGSFTITGSTTLVSPTLVSPSNGAKINSLTPQFQWNASAGAGVYVWEIMYVDSNILTTNQVSAGSGKLSWGQQYTWRVRACTDSSMASCGDWSSQWIFTTQAAAPSSPVVTISANPLQLSSGGFTTLSWASSSATSCVASSSPSNIQWDGAKTVSGSQAISNLTATTVFTLFCTGTGGSKSNNVNVTVGSSASATKQIIITSPNGGEKWEIGKTHDITWNSAGIDKVNISIEFANSGGLGIITNGISASLGKYSWIIDASASNNALNKILISDASDSNIHDKSNDYFTIIAASTTIPNCDSSSFLSSSLVFDFQGGGSKTNLCGENQYFKTVIPSGQTCDLKWTLQSDASSDYDLYIKNDSSVTRNVWDSRSTEGKGVKDEIIKTGLSAGTYYALAYKQSGTGSYSITSTQTNCSGSTNTTTTTPTTATTTTTTNTTTDAKIVQLQNQINQLLSQISQLQTDLTRIQNTTGQASTTPSGANGCYTFTKKLKYQDSGYAVGSLQAILKREGVYSGIISGYFGQATARSVTAFQEKYASEILTPFNLINGTGFVGSSTINKLNKLYGCK